MKLFPWPVLTDDPNGDYPGQCIVTDNLRCEAVDGKLIIGWEPATNSTFVNQLLSAQSAHWVIEVLCPRTMLVNRRTHHNGSISITLSADDVRGSLHFRAHVVASSPIEIEPAGLKPELAGKYALDKGDQIATFEMSFETDPEFVASPGLKSLLTFKTAEEHEEHLPYKVDMRDGRIWVTLPKSTYDLYARGRNDMPAGEKLVATGLLALPALVVGIGMLAEAAKENPGLKADDVETDVLRRLALLIRTRIGIEPRDIRNDESGHAGLAVRLMQADGKLLSDCLKHLTK